MGDEHLGFDAESSSTIGGLLLKGLSCGVKGVRGTNSVQYTEHLISRQNYGFSHNVVQFLLFLPQTWLIEGGMGHKYR
jgi:hypothetical protein